VVGARKFLIAWNINLRTPDIEAARAIAREIREANGCMPFLKRWNGARRSAASK
jgi:glutamate formiminotransferase